MPPQLEPASSQLVSVIATIALTLLMGLEREVKSAEDRSYIVAGIRTFPLVGLLGYSISYLSAGQGLAIALGAVSVSGFLVVSYQHKLRMGEHGATTEVAVLVAYMVGALIGHGLLWMATPVAVASVLLLQSKGPLEQFAVHLPRTEVATLVKFLILAAVILPVLPNHEFTEFKLNPFKVWLVVVVVSGISYASYLVQKWAHSQNSVILTALLGGAYSSTLTTVVLARHGREAGDVRLYAGATLLASGIMYVRLAVLLWIFNAALGWQVGPRFLGLALVTCAVALAVARLGHAKPAPAAEPPPLDSKNPLEMTTALIFAGLFIAISVVTQLATRYLGSGGLYALAAVLGISDIDPFIMSLTQTAGAGTHVAVAGVAIVIASASNNIVKGIYAATIGGKKTGLASGALLWALGLGSLVVLIGM